MVTNEILSRDAAADIAPLNDRQLFERILRLSVADGTASERTMEAYRAGLALFLGWCGHSHGAPAIDPRRATFDDIQAYRSWLASAKGYKRSTVRLRLQAVKLLYTAFQRWGVRPDNPAAGVRAPRLSSTATAAVLRLALSPDQAKQLDARLRWDPAGALEARDNAMLGLMLYHGLREEEIASLDDLGVDMLTYRRLDILGKGMKTRVIVLVEDTARLLRHWVDFGHGQPNLEHASRPFFYALDRAGREGLTTRSILRAVDRRLTELGLKVRGRGGHALRHTYAVMATLGGADQKTIAESMGHSDIRTTDVYTRAAAQWMSNPAAAVTAALRQIRETGAVKPGELLIHGAGVTFEDLKLPEPPPYAATPK